MKKSLIIATAAVLFVCSGLCAIVSNSNNCSKRLLEANVEALSASESQDDEYEQSIWYKYFRSDGGFNCVKGGSSKC